MPRPSRVARIGNRAGRRAAGCSMAVLAALIALLWQAVIRHLR